MTSTDVGQLFWVGYFLHLHNAILWLRSSFLELKRILACQFSLEGSAYVTRLLIFSCPLNSKSFICHLEWQSMLQLQFDREQNAKRNTCEAKIWKASDHIRHYHLEGPGPWKEFRPHAFVSASLPTENFVLTSTFTSDRNFRWSNQILVLFGKLGKAEWKPSNQPSGRKADKQHNSTQVVFTNWMEG